MAIDGSFCLRYELKRFLSRCPKLACIPQFQLLVKKEQTLTEEEVVSSMAQLFIHPKYTIPLVGCFRPIAQKIVDKTVDLLHKVPNLGSNFDDFMGDLEGEKFLRGNDDSNREEVVNVIDFHVSSRRGLNLHELACLAFCRAVDLAPYLSGSVLNYFNFAPPPFKRIIQKESVSELLVKVGTHLLNVIRVSYRLLLSDPEVFSTCWDWSYFSNLVEQLVDHDPGDRTEFSKIYSDVRWCVIQIMSVVLKISDRASTNIVCGSEEAFACLLRWQEFCQDVALEKAGCYFEPVEEKKLTSINGGIYFSEDRHLQSFDHSCSSVSSSMIDQDEPLIWNGGLATRAVGSTGDPFILTHAVKKGFEMVLLAVNQKWPVLLHGPAGSGKTSLINKLARDNGSRVLHIHMDELIDGKTLIGSYVCTEQPGEFRWQPGSLTQAVLNGYWIVFEDIDNAPSDVHSILLPLLEGANSFLTGQAEAIRVAEGFRLFSTISSSRLEISRSREGGNLLSALWRKVMIGPSNYEDLLSIVKARYPDLKPLADKLIGTLEKVNQLAAFQFGSSSVSSLSRFSLRDLLKWCKRISGLGFRFDENGLSTFVCKSIFLEAVDIFASSISSPESRLVITKEIAKIWSVEPQFNVSKPTIQESKLGLHIGRAAFQLTKKFCDRRKPFVNLHNSLCVLERIACSVKYNEPVLLVGETGTGKTTVVQNLAMRLGRKLTVLNLSQQSDVTDLLGGFKPMNSQFICIPLYKEFEKLFVNTFSQKRNDKFLLPLRKCMSDKNWKGLLRGFQKCVERVAEIGRCGSGTKRKRDWENFSLKLEAARAQLSALSGMVFSYVEGAFVTAFKNGDWVLLDEVNLAPPETLQRIIGVLEEENGSFCLAERGDADYIPRHPNFRIFACMNPATDAGKRDLPFSLRSRFTEYFVDDVLEDEDLILFINQCLEGSHLNRDLVDKIVRFYKAAKKESEERLQDGANQKPQYSLRSLYRALEYTNMASKKLRALEYKNTSSKKYNFQRVLYDGFCMFFLTLLDKPSARFMNQMILSYLLGGEIPSHVPFSDYLKTDGKFNPGGFLDSYVLTESVKEHLRNLARAIFIGRYPVLLQGPTSSGKTSLVRYLATITGHEFVRINNHEHTDLQGYLGSYVTDATGKLVFQEGVLVKAVRNGYWIVLDELNLAPSDVLEALNRLLDDNRELFVPELNELVHAHQDFMLFATQNPPTFYAGRKMLSRAFRNRFVEIHVDEIPEIELCTIVEKRCHISETHAKKMVEVMKELQLRRQSSKVFAGKHGFITPRDLFRWADRFRTFGNSYEDLAREGYYLLAERLRNEAERSVVQEVLERLLRIKLAKEDLYKQEPEKNGKVLNLCKYAGVFENFGKIVWTESMWRLYFLVEHCYKLREPVLLVGETGGGKTTVCQLLSIVFGSKLHILNCHQYTETSDFIGGFYPLRERSKIALEFRNLCENLMLSKAFVHFHGDVKISSDISQASMILDELSEIVSRCRRGLPHPDVTLQDLTSLEHVILDLGHLHQKWRMIFMWQDGPLVRAMKNGDIFLVDEISLADDSVLERLNSVLEPEKKLSLAEKGGSDLETITAHPSFFLLATMNPGGDYGKKELSPALRNRFTEIWVPPVSEPKELRSIALQRISNPELSFIVDPMLNFWEWFDQLQTGRILTVRDLLSWVDFINVTTKSLQPELAFVHGAFLILLDGLSLGTSISKSDAGELRERCLSFLVEQLKGSRSSLFYSSLSMMENYGWGEIGMCAAISCNNNSPSDNHFGIHPFYIEKGDDQIEFDKFEFLAPTTCRNTLRVLRAMQLAKPVLLEGSPGVGKTSLIVALGKFSGHTVVRINLSEQTDIMDLLGSDLPVESDEGLQFAWSDGILLQALKNGSWVLLDEINLAPQSVLEGLNAILDHRAEVYIPELGLTFKCPSSFRVFACQNPFFQGGGRKGLPKSFLNRFTKVYVDELVDDDYVMICNSLHPSIPRPLLSKLILFNKRLHEEIMLYHKFAEDGSPWEFNLRDVIRSCQIIQDAPERAKSDCFLNTIYLQRMRTAADRREVIRLYKQVFGQSPFLNPYPRVQLNRQYVIIGNTSIKRNHFQSSKLSKSELKILPGIRHSLEAIAQCVRHQWLSILIGPASSGKTSLIRLLAQLTGNRVNELNLSPATDISELLGCFEQYNAYRDYRFAVSKVETYINEFCSLSLESSMGALVEIRKDWLDFLSKAHCSPSMSSISAYIENWNIDSICLLIKIIKRLRLELEKYILPVAWSCEDLDWTLKTIQKLQTNHQVGQHPAKFEWVTGLLTKAMQDGEWIVLENANICNPTVLDRINSLVEPHGSITVNERGIVDGKPMVIRPHCQFRMFLTVNPGYGEVSRAMRNRGVEIYMMQPTWLLEVGSVENHHKTDFKEVKRFLTLSGVPGGKLVDSMANAHIYARNEGLHFNINITYLELSRWVQLFQRLLTNGDRPLWSLHISWEHTYLSSFGEAGGNDVVTHAILSFLSMNELCKFDPSIGCSLSLPGGWPTPLRLSDYIWYPKETCVKQNCMYLEFLGTEMASYMCSIAWDSCPMQQVQTPDIYLMDAKKMHAILFPKASNHEATNYGVRKEFDLAVAKKMLFFAANWVIEQVNESDLELYLCWFSWFGSHVQQFCHFFRSFIMLLKQELKHPVWTCIMRCRNEILSDQQIDLDLKPIPILSLELVDLYASDDMPKSSSRLFRNAIRSVGLLRLSLKQWNDENEYDYSDASSLLIPLLRSLRHVEERVLEMLVQPSSFDVLFELYAALIEDHISFWNGITSSQFEQSLVSWQFMAKKILKLEEFFPTEIGRLEVEIEKLVQVFHSQKSLPWVHDGHPFFPKMEFKKLVQVLSLRFHSQKSLLWVHGGHPFLPSSADLYRKLHQLLQLCESIWPQKTISLNKDSKDCLVEVAASSVPELRFLAMKGVSSFVIAKVEEDDSRSIWELEEMHQMLLSRFENEKNNLRARIGANEPPYSVARGAACCVLCSDLLCGRSGFDSWRDNLPIIDSKSYFLDMELLEELSKIVLLDAGELYAALSGLSEPLEYTLDFSLKFSSRPPTDFVPHKKLLRSLDAWTSACEVNIKVAVLELWFRWHSSLWTSSHTLDETISRTDGCVPEMFFHPVKMASVNQILRGVFAIKDYHMSSLKLRVASLNLWRSSPPVANISSFLLSTARSVFQQIIHAHRKSFEANEYAAIDSTFCSFQNNIMKEENVDALVSRLASSSHHGLSSSMSLLIKPILGELYLQCPSTDSLHSIGCAWLRIGELRYRLLISCDDLGCAVRYSSKYSRLLEKIALHELETEIRQECSYLAGSFSLKEAGDHRGMLLENLKSQLKRLQRKIVFRSDPGKFKKLKEECEEFLKVVADPIDQTMDVEQIAEHVRNLQGKTSCFIGLLSSKFPAYMDIVQPIQVAIYEMKLGLSLVLSSALQKQFLDKIGKVDMDMVQEAIYLFMRFPRCYTFKDVPDNLNIGLHVSPSCIIDSHSSSQGLDLNLLEVLLTLKRDVNVDEMVSVSQMKATIHHNILLRVAHSVADSQLMDKASFMLLDTIFDEFAKLWVSMKVQQKSKDDHEAQEYKFKPRAFKLEDVIEVDISTFDGLYANGNFSEWQELLSEEESNERKKGSEENETLEEEWSTMQESILNSMVSVHNQLFGSIDLLQDPGFVEVSDADRLSSFIDSYTLGAGMACGLQGLLSSSLDTKLVPEHLLRLCLEHEQKFVSSDKSTRAYNFYKDSNASMMVKMVELLAAFKQRILFLLGEWDDHPALQSLLDVTEMILAIPSSTPLAKALSGLHFLLNRVRNLQETVSKFPLSDQLEPIFALVSSWQKLEFDCWPSLLNEVQGQYETNAGKLWYPLYSVLHHRHSADVTDYVQSTVQSLDEFIQTSSIGEFRKRLQFLFAFHNQISTGICRGSYSSPCQIENMKILYNTFGFYVQVLPTILEHIEVSKWNIEMELKELLKLCRWEHFETDLSVGILKKTRQKFQKLMQKYTDVLQQPVMLVLNQEMAQSGMEVPSKPGLKLLCDSSDKVQKILNLACTQIELRDKDWSAWFMDWRKKVDLAFQSLNLEIPDFPHNSKNDKDIAIAAPESVNFVYKEEWKQACLAIDEICRTVIYCGDLWKDENKNLGKRRALFDLLKLLENSGLSKRMSMFLENQVKSNPSSSWFLQPSYDVQHLLLTHSRLPSSLLDVSASSQSESSTDESLIAQWKIANEHYFKSIASVHVLRMVCQNFHKDFTLEQVNRSLSFIDHLIIIQQEQRAAAYGFAEQLRCLRKCVLPLENLFSSSSTLIKNQCATFKCMWQQKQLFDCLCIMLHEECLLLKTVENNHLITCGNVRPAAERIHVFFEKYIPDFRKSKDSLDSYLLGHSRVFAEALAVHPYVISEEMEQLVSQNFKLMMDFEECFSRLQVDGRSVEKVLLGRFEDIFKKNKLIEEEYDCARQAKAALGNAEKESNYCRERICNLETGFGKAVMGAYKSIVDALNRIGLLKNGCAFPDAPLSDITSWKLLFESYVTNLQLNCIFDEVVKTIHCGVELLKYYGVEDSDQTARVGERLTHLYSLLNLVLSFGDQLLYAFLTILRLVSVTTHLLADIFVSLYSKGFGLSLEDEDNSSCINTRNATGTGMGEGAGQTDVSDQIIDEDQLLGTSEKLNEEKDALDETPSKNENGVEMGQDFAADTFSVSEDSEDDNNEEDGENEQLESAVGDTGADGEIVDEKIWDKTDDENPDNKNEKYEPGPSVKGRDSTCRELRGKEDPCTPADDTGELSPDEFDKQNDENDSQDNHTDSMEDMNLDKEDAFADPTGLKLDEPKQGSEEDMDIDEPDGADPIENVDQQELEESAEDKNGDEENADLVEETSGGARTEQVGGNSQSDDPANNQGENMETSVMEPKKDVHKPNASNLVNDQGLNAEPVTQPKGNLHETDLRDTAPDAKFSDGIDVQNDLTPMQSIASATEVAMTMSDSSDGRLSDNQPKSGLPQHDSLAHRTLQPNPGRHVGDALEDWKKGVKVSIELQENNLEPPEDDVDGNANEYGYTAEFETGTAQALGPATAEQSDVNIDGDKPDAEGKDADREEISEMEIQKPDFDSSNLKTHIVNLRNEMLEEMGISDLDMPPELPAEVHGHVDGDPGSVSESLVSMNRTYMSEDIYELGTPPVSDNELGRAHKLEEASSDMKNYAAMLWRRYELLTTRLSQELAEQLRLVMEPTLASKLQGDYKTGKRINMKKVIPYIASHYRKDKIWLRRTRPSKRDYQIVIAVDDSRSMSESCCGDVAIEALVTVCRAMSQLEVGKLAVASFGKKGNIRLLHDFDQPFTGEAGIKMISSLTFKQENTIADEPMVDLLKYLNNMLDGSMMNARLLSGQSPLQQLVLIIADGRLHEKENLKRCVRDAMSRKRMVAFLVLDSPKESILELKEAFFQGGEIKLVKYLDSFPFPYYIVLRNIEALPRTLGDLLRQWFELMQQSRD